MPITTIRLPGRLKARVAAAAKQAGKTETRFILEAIEEKTASEKRRHDFLQLADKRHAEIVATGKTIPWREVRAELKKRLAGKKPRTGSGKGKEHPMKSPKHDRIPTALEQELLDYFARTVERQFATMADRLEKTSRRLDQLFARLDPLKPKARRSYEPDDRPLTQRQVRAIRKRAKRELGGTRSPVRVRSTLF